jgi:hypothetical protein
VQGVPGATFLLRRCFRGGWTAKVPRPGGKSDQIHFRKPAKQEATAEQLYVGTHKPNKEHTSSALENQWIQLAGRESDNELLRVVMTTKGRSVSYEG